MHFLAHILGIDSQQSYWYDFWSGVGTQLSVVFAAIAYYAKHNCHHPGCPYVGKHNYDGTPYCSKHHPRMGS